MTSLLARSRKAATSIWTSPQRTGGSSSNWQCSECRRARKALGQQRRGYSDGTKSPAGEYAPFDGRAGAGENVHELPRSRPQQKGKSDHDAAGEGQPRRIARNVRMAGQAPEGRSQRVEAGPMDQRTVGSSIASSERDVEESEAIWERFSEVDEAGPSASERIYRSRPGYQTELNAKLDGPSKDELSSALLNNEADPVARCLLAAIRSNDLDFIRDIPKTTFSEIIRTLDTRHFVAILGNVHVDLSTKAANALNIAPMREVAFEYASVLRQVLTIRRAAGIGGTLSDYRILLRCARDLGNRKMAELVWSDLSSQDIIPDVRCYNHYMSATVWNGMHLAGFRQKVRVMPFFTMARKNNQYKDRRYSDYSTGEGGVLESTMRIFNEMVAQGIAADEESFRILIVAAAREGDLKTVKAILKRVWSIDVDGILANGNSPPPLPRVVPKHSPLYPYGNLLFTIAHAFGINNDVPAAIRVVDLVSRHYNMNISKEVWAQLMEWTFVLSIQRHSTNKLDGSREGQISADSVQKLWQTMIGPPYNIKPTMGMYNYMIKSLFQRDMSGQIAELLEGDVMRLYGQQRRRFNKAFRSLPAKSADFTSVENWRKWRELEKLIAQRNQFWVRRWLRLLLGSFNHTFRLVSVGQHVFRSLPRLLWKWRDLVPTEVRYQTPTGMVQLEFRTEQELIDVGLATYASKMKSYEGTKPDGGVFGNSWTHRKPHLSRRLAEAKGVPYDPQTHADVLDRRSSRKTNSNRTVDV